VQALAVHWEEVIVRALTTITNILPSPYADSAHVFDMIPHPSIASLLSLSQLPELLGSLLRNDSITDWISRSELYYAMLALLRRLADCELTVRVLIDEQWEKSRSCGIEEWMQGEGEITWDQCKDKSGTMRPSRSPPLYAHFKKLSKQCEAFLAGASQLMDGSGRNDEDTEDIENTAIRAASLCGDIIAARDDIERAMKVMSKGDSAENTSGSEAKDPSQGIGKGPAKGKNLDPTVEMERAYARACERLAFKHVTMSSECDGNTSDSQYREYNYARELAQTASMTRNPKDRLHLVKELAVMATCLPPGVWVRVDEVRNDAM